MHFCSWYNETIFLRQEKAGIQKPTVDLYLTNVSSWPREIEVYSELKDTKPLRECFLHILPLGPHDMNRCVDKKVFLQAWKACAVKSQDNLTNQQRASLLPTGQPLPTETRNLSTQGKLWRKHWTFPTNNHLNWGTHLLITEAGMTRVVTLQLLHPINIFFFFFCNISPGPDIKKTFCNSDISAQKDSRFDIVWLYIADGIDTSQFSQLWGWKAHQLGKTDHIRQSLHCRDDPYMAWGSWFGTSQLKHADGWLIDCWPPLSFLFERLWLEFLFTRLIAAGATRFLEMSSTIGFIVNVEFFSTTVC